MPGVSSRRWSGRVQRPRTLTKKNRIARTLDDSLGPRAIDAIGALDVIEALRPYEARGNLDMASAARVFCSQVFRFAIAHGAAQFDPAAAARDAIARPRLKHHAAVTDPREVGELMRALHGAVTRLPQVRAGLLLSAYLFPRSSEIRHMKWSQIYEATWTVPADQMKGKLGQRRDHLVPLSRQALATLDWIRPMTGTQEHVLGVVNTKSGLLSENTFNKTLDTLGFGKARHRHHGFRTTFSTNMNEMGWNSDWIEAQLAHVGGNSVRGVYNKAQYLPDRTRMMQTYADWLDERAAEVAPQSRIQKGS